mgnify:CR=1 FL=1
MSSFRPRQFDLIAFDWDGTLFDSTAIITRCIQLAVQDVGGQVPTREQASYVIGMALMPALAHAAPDVPQDKYPLLGERYRHHYMAHQHDISLFDGVLEMLAELKSRHHWLTVATGKSRIGLDRALAATGLGECFAITRTVDECRSKPHPHMLDDITEFLGADKRRTLMVGDTTHDLQMAQNAGTWGAGVSYGAHPVEALRDCAPLACFDSFAEFDTWLTPRLAN